MMIQRNDPDDLAFELKNKDKGTKMNSSIPSKNVSQRFIMVRVLNKINEFFLDLIKQHCIFFLQLFHGFFKACTKFDAVFHATNSSDTSRHLFD